MPYDDRSPRLPLAEGFADRVVTLARGRGAPAASLGALRHAAREASQSTAEGRVCVAIGDIAQATGQGDEDVRTLLLESNVVATADAPANEPLVLDDHGRLYLHRYFDYECRLAKSLMARAAAPIEPVPAGLREQLDALFAGNARQLGDRIDWQKIAVAFAMMRKLTIISGGPGTGKTTTIVNLLACLVAQQADCRIRLAAPTGKAAARMLDAIRSRVDQLEPEVAARFPTESFTIHRLLGAHGDGNVFRNHAGNPLPLDVLVVDEASMLDLALATRLFEAVPDAAKVILLGDKDQLAAVEAGAVFAEVCADPTLSDVMRRRLAQATGIHVDRLVTGRPTAPTPLRDCVVWFTESFRFGADSGIGRLAAMINAGEAEETIEWLRSGTEASVTWIEDADRTPSPRTVTRIHEGYRPYLEAVQNNADPGLLFETFNRFRVLCAERAGPRGVAGLNEVISGWFRAELDHPLDPGARSPWYPGRPVMVLRNDYVLRLYNGDVGIACHESQQLVVLFADSRGGYRSFAPARLPPHQTTFASTVHKAQGSEFDAVSLVLPGHGSPLLTRELAYTGTTRAIAQVLINGSRESLIEVIATRGLPDTGIVDRMAAAYWNGEQP